MPISNVSYPVNYHEFWALTLKWAFQFSHAIAFSDNHIPYPEGGFPVMIMAGCRRQVTYSQGEALKALRENRLNHNTWLAGYFSYDLKNEIEKLSSNNSDHLQFPEMCFFEPEHVLIFHENELEVHSETLPDILLSEILNSAVLNVPKISSDATVVKSPDKEEYLKVVNTIKEHILDGDIYELNYCVDFLIEKVTVNPIELYQQLTARSPTPFSTCLKANDHYLISASPERFLRKNGTELLSQPIKGTARRVEDPVTDQMIKDDLFNSEKERAENMMIVDLVRNDLARSSVTGSVHVPELFGIYSFQNLHQMISSVKSELRTDINAIDAIINAFPMGSMTGAPKIKVMELIEKYETSMRGIYSGAAGFIQPNGDFDFNVVIRSIAYNHNLESLNFWVGSAITSDSIPENEYDECWLKAQAILEILSEAGIADIPK